MERRLRLGKWLATATAIGMFIVLLMGARVTATGSGEGCGTDWPLCHGSWLPADTYESLTEYSHRFVTGIEGLIVLATTIVTWPMRKRFPAFTLLVPLMAGTLILQSLMGAAAVRWPQSAEVMATHFGISLVCLASAALLARVITQSEHGRATDGRAVSPGFRLFVIALLGMSIVTAYAGAYVRHTESELACSSWPTCDGELIPSLEGPAGIQTLHRLTALVISLMIVALLAWTWKLRESRPDLLRLATVATLLVLAQSLVGREVIYSGLALMATLSHAGLMAILFVLLCENVRAVWPMRHHARLRSLEPSPVQPAPGD